MPLLHGRISRSLAIMTTRTSIAGWRRLLVALACGGVALVVAHAVPSDAKAQQRCPSGYVCMWEHSKFRGEMFFKEKVGPTSCLTLPREDWDRASSWANRNWVPLAAVNYRHWLPDEHLWTMLPGSTNGWVGGNDNDRADIVCSKGRRPPVEWLLP